MDTKLHFSSKNSEWETPDDLFLQINQAFALTLDVCATQHNTKLPKYITPEQDALTTPWGSHSCWMNPPYGREISKWMARAVEQYKSGAPLIVALIPARTDTNWWFDFVVPHASIVFIKGRLKFKGAEHVAPFPSALAIYSRNLALPPLWWDRRRRPFSALFPFPYIEV